MVDVIVGVLGYVALVCGALMVLVGMILLCAHVSLWLAMKIMMRLRVWRAVLVILRYKDVRALALYLDNALRDARCAQKKNDILGTAFADVCEETRSVNPDSLSQVINLKAKVEECEKQTDARLERVQW